MPSDGKKCLVMESGDERNGWGWMGFTAMVDFALLPRICRSMFSGTEFMGVITALPCAKCCCMCKVCTIDACFVVCTA